MNSTGSYDGRHAAGDNTPQRTNPYFHALAAADTFDVSTGDTHT